MVSDPKGIAGRPTGNRVALHRMVAQDRIRKIISGYDSWVIRAYCRIRFVIMRLRFLEELDQYLPAEGQTVDLGCGFGLFSLYFASATSTRRLLGIDLSDRRVQAATRCARRLGLDNVSYQVGDATDTALPERLGGVYMLDLLHHVPPDCVPVLLQRVHTALRDDGVLLVKDVDTSPAYKRWFTLMLDRAMVGMEPIRYWSAREMIAMLENAGFRVYTHEMRDLLPYPHRLYICSK